MNIERINFEIPNLKTPIIIIIGPPGAGKTVVGTQLAKTLNWDFYDTDVLIEQATSMKVSEIFSKHTEAVFRQLEQALVSKLVEIQQKLPSKTNAKGGTIISCGGGLPIPAKNFADLAKLGTIICLQAPANILMERIGQIKNRPLLNAKPTNETKGIVDSERIDRLEKLLAERKAIYAKAKYQIDTNNQTIEMVVDTIRSMLKL